MLVLEVLLDRQELQEVQVLEDHQEQQEHLVRQDLQVQQVQLVHLVVQVMQVHLVVRVLMDQTVSRTLEEALSENLTELAQTVTADIQDRMKSYELGIEPIVFTFTALHPPVSVAKDYQEVVSAQIDVLTKQYRAQQYQLQSIPKARATTISEIEKAKQEAANLIASAKGEAASFEGLRQTVRQAQDLYRFRIRQDNLQKTISGKSVIILDHRLEQQGATLWIEP